MPARPLFPLRDETAVDPTVRAHCRRIDDAVARLIELAATRALAPWRWVEADAERIVHPLGVHAIARNGRPDLREGTSAAETHAAVRCVHRLRQSLHDGDAKAIGGALRALATEIGVRDAAIRSGPSAIQPDGGGVMIEFAAPQHIAPRLDAMAAFYRDPSVPNSFKAIALQAALLNLHPLRDGNGRVSRALFNCVLWGDHVGPALYVPIYDLREHAPYTFEICLRSAEIQDNWQPIAGLYAELIESRERDALHAA